MKVQTLTRFLRQFFSHTRLLPRGNLWPLRVVHRVPRQAMPKIVCSAQNLLQSLGHAIRSRQKARSSASTWPQAACAARSPNSSA